MAQTALLEAGAVGLGALVTIAGVVFAHARHTAPMTAPGPPCG